MASLLSPPPLAETSSRSSDVLSLDSLDGPAPSAATWRRSSETEVDGIAGPMALAHWITGLSIGGAEIMLLRVLQNADRARFAPSVTSLQPGRLAPRIAALGIPVSSLGMRTRLPGPGAFMRLWRAARTVRPAVLQGWMYHGNLAATVSCCLLGLRPPLVWGIHHTVSDLDAEKWSTRMGVRVNALLSHLPDAIVYVSEEGARQHERIGFPPDKSVVIPNGFDGEAMRPDADAPARLRAELGVPDGRPIVGTLTRAHPMKDHANLIRAAALLRERSVDVHVLMMGSGVASPDGDIAGGVAAAGLDDRVSLLPEHEDTRPVLAGLDVLVVSSAWGESFPLVVGDAMACGVPCVVTDLGHCATLVGDTGIVVPVRDSAALADGIARMVALGSEGRRRLGAAARERVLHRFSVAQTARRYEELYHSLIERRHATASPAIDEVAP